MLASAVASLKWKWPHLNITDDGEVATDNFDFLIQGVPNLLAIQDIGNYPVVRLLAVQFACVLHVTLRRFCSSFCYY